MQTGVVVLLLIGAVVIGGIVGFILSRITNKSTDDNIKNELESLQERFDSYKKEVTEHFNETAQLTQKLSQSYQDVQTHLAHSAETLISDASQREQLLEILTSGAGTAALTYDMADHAAEDIPEVCEDAPLEVAEVVVEACEVDNTQDESVSDDVVVEVVETVVEGDEVLADAQPEDTADSEEENVVEAEEKSVEVEEESPEVEKVTEEAIVETVVAEEIVPEVVSEEVLSVEVELPEDVKDNIESEEDEKKDNAASYTIQSEAPRDYAPKVDGEPGTLTEEFKTKYK